VTAPVPASGALSVDRFVEAFVAGLVLRGVNEVEVRSPQARRGFRNVVQLFDEQVGRLKANKQPWAQVWPWVHTANRLRVSPLGGVENWEHQLRCAQRAFTRIPNPTYERVNFSIDATTAEGELNKLNDDQRAMVSEAVERFRAAFPA
jgi:hypothetical protein